MHGWIVGQLISLGISSDGFSTGVNDRGCENCWRVDAGPGKTGLHRNKITKILSKSFGSVFLIHYITLYQLNYFKLRHPQCLH